MTVNEQLRDEAIRHAVNLERFTKAQIVDDVLPLLKQAEDDLVAKIARTGGEWTRAYLTQMLDEVRQIYADACNKIGQVLTTYMKEQAQHELDFGEKQLNDALPEDVKVFISTTTPSTEQVWAAITTNPADRGHTFGELLKAFSEGEQSRIVAAIRQGYVEGETVQKMMQRIRGTRANRYQDGVLQGARRRAEAVVRTGVMHVSNQARNELYKANDDLVKGVAWLATLDTSTCEECAVLDGKDWDIDADHPEPPLHFSCRCCTTPVVKSWQELGIDAADLLGGTRASMDGQVPASTDYQSWLERQSKAIQDEALGPGRAELFRNGTTLEDMVDRGRLLRLDELKAKESGAAA